MRKAACVTVLAMSVLTAGLLVPGCEPAAPPATAALQAFVTIAPQKTFLQRLGDAHVDVQVLVPAGQDPHLYSPTPQQVAALSQANVYFRVGIPFENTVLQRLGRLNPELLVVDTTAGIALREMAGHHHHEHEAHEEHAEPEAHDQAEDHHADHEAVATQQGKDPHVWLAPLLAARQAENMAEALMELDPDHAETYRQNLADLVNELERLDSELHAQLDSLPRRSFMVFHPAFGYFADAYGLTEIPVEIEGKEPSAQQLADLIERARREDIHVLFVNPQFSRHSAEAIAKAIDGRVVTIDPLAADYFANLRQVARSLVEALQ